MLRKIFSPKKRNKSRKTEIDRILSELDEKHRRTISILLLGPHGSGKSTILKQIEIIYRGAVHNKILKNATFHIKQNIKEYIYDLSQKNKILQKENPRNQYLSMLIANHYLFILAADLNLFIPSEITHIISKYYCYCLFQLSKESQIICKQIASTNHSEEIELTPDLAKQISILWNDRGLQETYNIRKSQIIMDNAPYFFQNIDRISQTEYVANFDDYIRERDRTCGIIESEVDFGDKNLKNRWYFKITDVGGARYERKKWLRCLCDIHAIIWVMSLNGYDRTLFEDHTQNRYKEALDVFEHIMKHEALIRIDVFVFLNKHDLFLRKIKEVPFTVFEPNFNKDLVHDPDAVKNYLGDEYKKRFYNGIKPDKSSRRIYFHVTCAIETNQIQGEMCRIQREMMIRNGTLM